MKKKIYNGLKLFIDFDDVLFNTRDFIIDYKKIFARHGVSEKIFKEHYYGYPVKQKSGKIKKYDPEQHIRILGENLSIDKDKLKKDVDDFTGKARRYVFGDSGEFLRGFKRRNLYLISYGANEFQKKKIVNSGLRNYFKRMFIFDRLKSEGIESLLGKEKAGSGENLFFLDDRIEQIDDVKKKYPKAITFFVKRPEGRYQDKRTKFADYGVKSLKEAGKILKRIKK